MRWTAAIVAALTLLSCASGDRQGDVRQVSRAHGQRLLLTDADRVERGSCSVSVGEQPPLAELMDSAAVAEAVAARWAAAGAPAGRALFSVRSDTAGTAEWVEVLESDVRPALARSVAAAIGERLRPRIEVTDSGPVRRGWSRRLDVRFEDQPAFRLGSSVHCRPAVANGTALARHLREQVAAAAVHRSELGRRALLWMRVGTDGRPMEVQLRNSTGSETLDHIAIGASRLMVFSPGSIDGRRIPLWVSVPVRFDQPRRLPVRRRRP